MGVRPEPLAHPLSPTSSARPAPGERSFPGKGALPPNRIFACESWGRGQIAVVPRAARGADGAGRRAGRGGAAGAPARSGGACSGCADRRAPPTHSAPPCVYVETKMAAAVTALSVRSRTVSH